MRKGGPVHHIAGVQNDAVIFAALSEICFWVAYDDKNGGGFLFGYAIFFLLLCVSLTVTGVKSDV